MLTQNLAGSGIIRKWDFISNAAGFCCHTKLFDRARRRFGGWPDRQSDASFPGPNANDWDACWQIKGQLKSALESAGLNIPFPQRVITFANAIPEKKAQ